MDKDRDKNGQYGQEWTGWTGVNGQGTGTRMDRMDGSEWTRDKLFERLD